MGGGGGVVLRLFLAEWSCFRVVFALELMDWVSSSFIVRFSLVCDLGLIGIDRSKFGLTKDAAL